MMQRIVLREDKDAVAFVVGDAEQAAWDQMMKMLDSPITNGSRVRFMPDFHYGKGCVIGTTMTVVDKVVPNVVGVDIGCGVYAMRLGEVDSKAVDWKAFDEHVRASVPHGVGGVHGEVCFKLPADWIVTAERVGVEPSYVAASMGTLGGGNHFIEVDVDEEGALWLLVHTGSRKFGYDVAAYHQRVANEERGKRNELNWLDLGEPEGQLYLQDMKMAQSFAEINRINISQAVAKWFYAEGYVTDVNLMRFDTVHNYVDFSGQVMDPSKSPLLRKGAVRALADELFVVPFNMAAGAVVCRGKGNEDWNCSAPHGAGRAMSRGEARRTLKLEDYEKQMAGVWSSCVSKQTLDEAPGAYKDVAAIRESLAPTADVVHELRPVYNFKA